jgi:hypothetical protein
MWSLIALNLARDPVRRWFVGTARIVAVACGLLALAAALEAAVSVSSRQDRGVVLRTGSSLAESRARRRAMLVYLAFDGVETSARGRRGRSSRQSAWRAEGTKW